MDASMVTNEQCSPFRTVPAEIRLHIIRHTNIHDLKSLMLSGLVACEDFRLDGAAVFRGIGVEQFSELEWLFGDSRYRSPEQKQVFKDFIAKIVIDDDRILLLSFDQVDNDEILDSSNIKFLQEVQELITTKRGGLERLGMVMTRRAALCLMLFASKKHLVYENQGSRKIIQEALTLEDLINIFKKQPVATRTELCSILEVLVLYIDQRLMPFMGERTKNWITLYYSETKVDYKMKPDAMGNWIAKLATGYILEVVVPLFGTRRTDIGPIIKAQSEFFPYALELELRNSGSSHWLWKDGRSFAECFGFDFDRILEATAVGEYLRRSIVENVCLGEN